MVKEQQRSIAVIVTDDVNNNYLKTPHAYMVLDPNSTDPEIQKIYRMLPYEFKAQYKALNGDKPIIIKREIATMVFGYTQFSLAKLWDKKPSELTLLEKGLKEVLNLLISPMAKNAKYKIISFERAVQMLMKWIKDFIVIRTPAVLIGNIIANTLMLLAQGISPVVIAKSYTKAWVQGKEYKQIDEQLSDVKAKLLINPKDKKLQGQINYLQNRLEEHPMREYMVNGFMSTIVDDVELVDGQTQFGSLLEEKLIKGYEKKVPKMIQNVVDTITMNSNTKLHKFMAEATQFSDFSAKVALIEHRKKQGVSFDDAAAEAQSIFLNFDVPQHQGMQYLDKMGLFMFMKFFIRFQGVLLRNLKQKPATMLLLQLLASQLGMIGILDPFILFRLGNPFSSSVFNLFDAFSGIAGIDLISSLFK